MNRLLNFLTKFKDPRTNWKYILIVVVLAFLVGGGILSYWWEIKKEEVKKPQVKAPEERRFSEAEIKRCLPSAYTRGNVLERKQVDLNNDGKEEIILTVEREKISELQSCSKTFIIGQEEAKCKLEWQSEEYCAYGQFVLVQDLNRNGIQEVIVIPSWPRSERIIVVEWDKGNYNTLFTKESSQIFGRKFFRGDVEDHFRDLNSDGKFEIITAEYVVYHAPDGLEDLYWYHVYKWNGEKYIEATSDFLEIFNEDVEIAEKLGLHWYIEKLNKLKKR
jgi:hypothetical protein